MSIIQFNISPDSYKGLISKDGKYSIFNGMKLPVEKNDIITVNGAVYKNEQGIVTQTMVEIYGDRKTNKKIAGQKHKEVDDLQKKFNELEYELLHGMAA
jgi:hypothetical protein